MDQRDLCQTHLQGPRHAGRVGLLQQAAALAQRRDQGVIGRPIGVAAHHGHTQVRGQPTARAPSPAGPAVAQRDQAMRACTSGTNSPNSARAGTSVAGMKRSSCPGIRRASAAGPGAPDASGSRRAGARSGRAASLVDAQGLLALEVDAQARGAMGTEMGREQAAPARSASRARPSTPSRPSASQPWSMPLPTQLRTHGLNSAPKMDARNGPFAHGYLSRWPPPGLQHPGHGIPSGSRPARRTVDPAGRRFAVLRHAGTAGAGRARAGRGAADAQLRARGAASADRHRASKGGAETRRWWGSKLSNQACAWRWRSRSRRPSCRRRPEPPARFELAAELLVLEQPLVALKSPRTAVRYRLLDRNANNRILYERVVRTEQNADLGDALLSLPSASASPPSARAARQHPDHAARRGRAAAPDRRGHRMPRWLLALALCLWQLPSAATPLQPIPRRPCPPCLCAWPCPAPGPCLWRAEAEPTGARHHLRRGHRRRPARGPAGGAGGGAATASR